MIWAPAASSNIVGHVGATILPRAATTAGEVAGDVAGEVAGGVAGGGPLEPTFD